MPSGAKEFQESITNELHTIKDRVRYLIGDANWGEEGRYKEAVLKNVLRKFLPTHLSVATGFIVKSNSSSQSIRSKQIDIIIYDNRIPVLFSEGDFIVTTSSNVRAVIEVKSSIIAGKFKKFVSTFETSLNRIPELFYSSRKPLFVGLFAFEYSSDLESEVIDRVLKESHKRINHICLGRSYFIRHWNRTRDSATIPTSDCTVDFYNVYEIVNLSFSYFISNILHLCVDDNLNDRHWYSFPIPGTKEVDRVRTICLDPGP